MVPKVARVAYMLLERGGFDSNFAPFRTWMQALMDALPDSRIVEQTHQKLRDMERSNSNNVTSRLARHNSCVFIGVLEERGLPAISLNEGESCDRMRSEGLDVPSMKPTFESRRHKLPRDWSTTLKP
eukprot:3348143-Pyramimonas_sp.AAC.1